MWWREGPRVLLRLGWALTPVARSWRERKGHTDARSEGARASPPAPGALTWMPPVELRGAVPVGPSGQPPAGSWQRSLGARSRSPVLAASPACSALPRRCRRWAPTHHQGLRQREAVQAGEGALGGGAQRAPRLPRAASHRGGLALWRPQEDAVTHGILCAAHTLPSAKLSSLTLGEQRHGHCQPV